MSIKRLTRIVDRLRARDGCPWDRRQTHRTLKPNLVEETYEVLHAIDRGSPSELKEELGDLLLQVVFHASIERERGRFTLDDAIRHVCDKLVRRHPHVFARGRRVNAAGALAQWEVLKGAEKPRRSGLDGVPPGLPALLRAGRLQSKAARLGFEWTRLRQAVAKLDEELRELRTAMRRGRRREVRHELGDVLFALAKLARFLALDPEDTLQAANDRFIRRFRRMERAVRRSGRRIHEVPARELYALWRRRR